MGSLSGWHARKLLAVTKQQSTNCVSSPRETDGSCCKLELLVSLIAVVPTVLEKSAFYGYLAVAHGKTGLVPRIHGLET